MSSIVKIILNLNMLFELIREAAAIYVWLHVTDIYICIYTYVIV